MAMKTEEEIKNIEKQIAELRAERDAIPDRIQEAASSIDASLAFQLKARVKEIPLQISTLRVRLAAFTLQKDKEELSALWPEHGRLRKILNEKEERFKEAKEALDAAGNGFYRVDHRRSMLESRIDTGEKNLSSMSKQAAAKWANA